MTRLGLVLAGALIAGGCASASPGHAPEAAQEPQEAPPQSVADELRLIDGLLRKGMWDMAQMICDRAIDSDVPSEQFQGELGMVKLQLARAMIEPDPGAQLERFDAAVTRFQSRFDTAAAAHVEAKLVFADLLFEYGLALLRRIQGTPPGASREALRQTALAMLPQASKLFGDVVDVYLPLWEQTDYLDSLPGAPALDPTKEPDLVRAWRLKGESLYHRSAINPDKRQRERDLKSAIEVLDEFIWEFEDRIVGFDAYVLQGRCYAARGSSEGAAACYRAVLTLDVEDFTDAVRLTAYWRLAQLFNGASQFEKTLEALTAMEKEYGDKSLDYRQGHAALTEKARAYKGLRRFGDAAATFARVLGAEDRLRQREGK